MVRQVAILLMILLGQTNGFAYGDKSNYNLWPEIGELNNLRSNFTMAELGAEKAGQGNILPMARPGVKVSSVITTAMVVAMIFCIVLLVAIWAAYLYGKFFLNAPDPNTTAGKVMLAATPFYMHPFVWSVAGIAAALAAIIWWRSRRA